MRLWLAACLFMAMGVGDGHAQDLHLAKDPRLHDLGDLYIADDASNYASLCAQRFPQTREPWGEALSAFSSRNRSQLAQLNGLQARVLDALRAGRRGSVDVDTWATVLNARMQRLVLEANSLAVSTDEGARSACEGLRGSYARTDIDEKLLASARAAAAAAVEDLARP